MNTFYSKLDVPMEKVCSFRFVCALGLHLTDFAVGPQDFIFILLIYGLTKVIFMAPLNSKAIQSALH